MSPERRVVYTDGACSGNPGPGGWAWAVAPAGPYATGAEAHTTNQRMEIAAVLEAVRALDGPLQIRSDSTYVVNCFNQRWWEKWLAKGWVNSQRKPVANRDLWEPLITLYRADPSRLDFFWVKGHSDDSMNDIVDRLAVEAATTHQARAGERLPDAADLGPPDTILAGRDRRLPPGRLLAVFGHRPPELGGYDDNPTARAVQDRIGEILAANQKLHPDLKVMSGLGLGAETLGAEAALAAGIALVAVQPFPDPDAIWPRASRDRYARLVGAAAHKVLLERAVPDSKPKVAGSLARRDGWLAREADEALVVWDGRDPALGKLVRSLEDRLGDDVWILDPTEFAPQGNLF
ncbi:MAG: ribonuclease H family protein [Acidimicrobiia bacterium]